MDYEKKYKEAIEKAKIWQEHLYDVNDKDYADELNYIFPELAESEDEWMVNFIKKQLFNIKKTITENYELDAKLTKAIDWLEKQGEQKSSWSEEDEKLINRIEGWLDTLCDYLKDDNSPECIEDVKDIIEQLKSLRPQSHWKPSESDILLLERITNGKSNPQDFQASLGSLIIQLKKLMEE